MKDFVSKNSKYLHFVTSESGDTSVETKHFNSPFRYFFNDEKIFQIEEKHSYGYFGISKREFIETVGQYGISIFGESIDDIEKIING